MSRIRVEFVVTGCILVVVGLVLIVAGHGRIQPDQSSQANSVLDHLTSDSTLVETSAEEDSGYLMMGIGALLVVGGIGLCAVSWTEEISIPGTE